MHGVEPTGTSQETEKEAIVFNMYEGKTIGFRLDKLIVRPWSELKGMRIGRLIPPYSTRVQQRYSAYLQRPGLTRIPNAAMPRAALEKHEKELALKEAAKAEKGAVAAPMLSKSEGITPAKPSA